MNNEVVNPAMNAIASEQDKPEMIALLRARDRVYRHAKLWQGTYVWVTVVLGVAGVVVSSEWKPFFGLAGILALLLDVAFLDQHLKDLCKLGARLGEDFDIGVLQLPRNTFVTDKEVPPEVVHEYSCTLLPPERERQLRGWYEPCVAQVPPAAGRLICQRLNVSYDEGLRTRYARWLLAAAIVFVVGLLFGALALGMAWADVVSAFGAALPALNWALRERNKNLEVAGQLAKLQGELERLWWRVLAGAGNHELEAASRQLQDAIFRQRASTTLIFGWVYQRLRTAREESAAHVAGRLVDDFHLRTANAN